MKIAQVAPLYESVPPKWYGGTERVVSYLTEELVNQGQEVTLFASGDSRTRARLVAACERSLRLDDRCIDKLAHHMVQLGQVFERAAEFDVLHFPFTRRRAVPHVTTLHGWLDLSDLQPLYRAFAGQPLVSISDAQRAPLPFANWQGTVYHGLPTDLFTFRERPGRYLAFLGRIAAEKRPDRAIDIARRTGVPLKIAAKVDPADKVYYREVIEPLIREAGSLVEYLGEIGGADKDDFLGNAYALLFPIDWPEPFGLVMIEALACGTPVIAYPHGSVPEVIDDGVTGYLVSDVGQAVQAVEKVARLSRKRCREVFEGHFSAPRMAADYLAVYARLTAAGRDGRLRKAQRFPEGRRAGLRANPVKPLPVR
jgi:glycosyltransferase involved in cell wall biosynthesis